MKPGAFLAAALALTESNHPATRSPRKLVGSPGVRKRRTKRKAQKLARRANRN